MSTTPSRHGEPIVRFMVVDLTGNTRLGARWRSVELEVDHDPDDWPADRLRKGAAEYYGVPLDKRRPGDDGAHSP